MLSYLKTGHVKCGNSIYFLQQLIVSDIGNTDSRLLLKKSTTLLPKKNVGESSKIFFTSTDCDHPEEVLKENICHVKEKGKLYHSLTFEKMKLCAIFMAYQRLCVSFMSVCGAVGHDLAKFPLCLYKRKSHFSYSTFS